MFAYDEWMRVVSANGLRREVHARAAVLGGACDVSYGVGASVVFAAEGGSHGNFLAASYKRIVADAAWAKRLEKSYTASARLPRAGDRWRGELECASSSDALLMNVFCYPGVLRRTGVCSLLGVEAGLRPEFGVRVGIAMRKEEVDRTEVDMRVGELLVEAKLTEGGFGTASRERLMRYVGVEEAFEVGDLPWRGGKVEGYQLIRGLLAATASGGRYLVLCDGRRGDMREMGFRVLRAVRSCEVRTRMQMLSWQELAGVLPGVVREFLGVRYGVGE